MSDFLKIIEERGFVRACSNTLELRDKLNEGILTAYIGYDATAASLHVGHLVNIMLLRWFQASGHRPITLMGGGTTKVGDPSFRSKERPLLEAAQIDNNIDRMQTVFSRFIDYGEGAATIAPRKANTAVMANNSLWLDSLNYLNFLRDIGRHFSVNRMLSFDSVRERLDTKSSLSFLEFNYMILQAYDFLELHDRQNCVLQMGGSDQWGNIINGIDLIRRVKGQEVFALTTPLLERADGTKMGKSDGTAIWLDPSMTSPFTFWQYWRNTDDRDVLRFLKLFTECDIEHCKEISKGEGRSLNDAKILLADEVTTLCHGREAAEASKDLAFDSATSDALNALPRMSVKASQPITILELLAKVGAVDSGKEARRFVTGGGVRINGRLVETITELIQSDLPSPSILSVGKNSRYIVTFEE